MSYDYNIRKTWNMNNDETIDKLVRNSTGEHTVPCDIRGFWTIPNLSSPQRKQNIYAKTFRLTASNTTDFTCAFLLKKTNINTDVFSLTFKSNKNAATNIFFNNYDLGYVEWSSSLEDVYYTTISQQLSVISATSIARYPIATSEMSFQIDSAPIFDNETDLNNYLANPTEVNGMKALNYTYIPPEQGNTFFIYSQSIGQTLDSYGNVKSETSVDYRDMRFILEKDKKACFYFKDGYKEFNLKLKVQGSVQDVEFSTDGLNFKSNGTTLAWTDFCYKDGHWAEDGLFYKAIFWQTNIPIFLKEEDANSYFDGTKDIQDSYNYNDLTQDSEKKVNIGQVVEEMDVNVTSTRGMFCSRYALGISNISEITDKLFTDDETIINKITEGLKFYGQEPLQSVIDLTYYPFDLTQYGNTSPQQYIYFGNYKLDLDNSVNKLANLNFTIDCGTINYPTTFNDYRDYEPFTEMYTYLPYCGFKKLNIASYIGKRINIKYGIDVTSGSCCAYIFADNKLIDLFTGSMGVRQFITSMDSSQYASNILSAITGSGSETIGGGAKMISSVGGDVGGFALGGVGTVIGIGKGIANLKKAVENVPFNTTGSTTSMLGQYSPQFPYFVFSYVKMYKCNNINLVGKPTNASGKVYNFSGFLKCSDVKIRSNATNEEQKEIISLLQNGVYI